MNNGQGCFGIPAKRGLEVGNEVFLYTAGAGAAGFGTTNLVIARYANVGSYTGTAITYTDSAVAGSSFKINVDGVYYVAMSWDPGGTGAPICGLSKNSTQLTTAIQNINVADQIAFQSRISTVAGTWCGVSAILNLKAHDIIRPHSDGTASNGAGGTFSQFRIVQIA